MIKMLAITLLRFAPLSWLLVFTAGLALLLVREKAEGAPLPPSLLPQTDYYLVVNKNLTGVGPAAGERWPLDEKITIGRNAQNDIVIDDPYVSAWHAQLERRGEELWLLDLNSTNGTMVNGERISGYRQIDIRDNVVIGGVLLGIERGEMHADCSSNPSRVSEATE